MSNQRPDWEEADEDRCAHHLALLGPDAALADLSDEQLLYFFDRVHHRDLVADRWVGELGEEVARRGLRRD